MAKNNSIKNVVVIGSGFAGLSAACHLAASGHNVTLLEKNPETGGRARSWSSDGFTFDMGPSWYWMPEVFEDFFARFGKKTSDYYQLVRLDPAYRIYFQGGEQFDVEADPGKLYAAFDRREKGSGKALEEFLKDAEFKYHTAMNDYVNRLSDSVLEFLEPNLIIKALQLNLLSSLRKSVRSEFKDPLLISILEFPVLFLGSTPARTPALYSMMNYADLVKGTWYPLGGMVMVAKAMTALAEELGVKIVTNCEVQSIETSGGIAGRVICTNESFDADVVVSGADYRHTEHKLLSPEARVYSESYWEKRTMSPSSLLVYVGLNKKVEGILHHTLFFDEDFEKHAEEIYDQPAWPEKPLFYLSAASKTDPSVAPADGENLVFLIPLAPGLQDSDEMREKYFNIMLERLEKRTGQNIREHIVVKRTYAMNDFIKDYHSFKGNAYGLANTLRQTAFLKPRICSKKVKNLFYSGQLTVPGPGVPPSIISGKIVSDEIERRIRNGKL